MPDHRPSISLDGGHALDKIAHASAMAATSWLSVRVIIALVVLGLWLGGCSSAGVPVIVEFPKATKVTDAEPEFAPGDSGNIPIAAVDEPAAAATVQEAPKDIVASQIRSQGYVCDSPQNAERNASASKAHEVVWLLECQNASYRVTLIPSLAAKVDKVGDESPSPQAPSL